jgi:transcriptional regulator with XRE-family HTH domain
MTAQRAQHPLKRWLVARGVTLSELARKASVDRSTLSKIVNGRLHGMDTLALGRLSDATGCDYRALAEWRWPGAPPAPKRRRTPRRRAA